MPSQLEVFGFVVGLLTTIVLLPVALLILWPGSRRVRILAAPRRSSPHRADGAAWLEREGFARLCALRHGTRLSGAKAIEVFHHPAKGVFGLLGDGPAGHPSVRLMTCCLDGYAVDTVASEGEEGPGAAEPGREQAWARHLADVAAASATHGPPKAEGSPESARQLAELTEWGPLSIADVRTRMVVGQVFLWPALAGVVLALASGWPWPSLSGGTGLGFKAIFGLAVAFNLGFELWFWRPWWPRVQVVAGGSPRVGGSTAARRGLEAEGFALLGQKTERSRRAAPCDVYAQEAERAWANVTSSQERGVFGYYLSTFADGASVITWTCPVAEKKGRLTVGWASGFSKAWAAHRAAVTRLGDTHGAREPCATPADREQATLAYYAAGGA